MSGTTQPVSRGEAIEFTTALESMKVEDGLQLIEDVRVKPLLGYLRGGTFENKTNMTFMQAYSVVVQFGDQQQHSFQLYAFYKKVIEDYCSERLAEMQGISGEELLRRLADLWEKNRILVFWMQRVFQYLDRFFTKNNNEYPDLFSAALQTFSDTVYCHVKDRCIRAMIEVINRERDGYDADQDVLKVLVEMLCTVGGDKPEIKKEKTPSADRLFWQSSSKGVYKCDFENQFLVATGDYYKQKVTGWLASCSCPQFLKQVHTRLMDEDGRLTHYLDRSSEQELRTVTQRELILQTAKRLVEMESGCQAMFHNRKDDELTLMFKLFRREPTMLPYMTGVMEPYIEDRCKRIIDDDEMKKDPEKYISAVLELKQELDRMVTQCFDSDSSFQKARNKGLENVLNKDTICAKFLAVFSDMQLKKSIKGMNEDEVTALITAVVNLFAHLKDKDIFLDFYKQRLSKRLLNKLSVSADAEDVFITKLKVECGQQAIQKLASMFNDMKFSDELQEEYSKLSHKGSPNGIQHEVRVLQSNAWPEKPEDFKIVPCEEMVACATAYENFYNKKHTGRLLRWMYHMGNVELTTHCFQRKHILTVSAYQCLAMMLLNKYKTVTFKQICDATNIPADECKRQVLSLTVSKHKILLRDGSSKEIEDDTKFEVNAEFKNEKVKVVVGLIKKEEKEAIAQPAEAPVERKHIVDAAIVRIMKARKTLDHTSLTDEVFRQCALFKPQPSQIKQQIEDLINREFLKRDPDQRNRYIYLP